VDEKTSSSKSPQVERRREPNREEQRHARRANQREERGDAKKLSKSVGTPGERGGRWGKKSSGKKKFHSADSAEEEKTLFWEKKGRKTARTERRETITPLRFPSNDRRPRERGTPKKRNSQKKGGGGLLEMHKGKLNSWRGPVLPI